MLDHEQQFRLRSSVRCLTCIPAGITPGGAHRCHQGPRMTRVSWALSSSPYWKAAACTVTGRLPVICATYVESRGKHRTTRLIRQEGLLAHVGYRRRPGMRGRRPAIVANNQLARQFDPSIANQAWLTDITYIRTHEGWLYLAVVLDFLSRKIVGWAMQSTMHTDLVLQALVTAAW